MKADGFWNILLENPGSGNNWVTLHLEGVSSNRSAIGAEITIQASGPKGNRTIYRVVGTGGSYGSSTLQQEIGLGKCNKIQSIKIYWPSSETSQEFQNVAINKFYHLSENQDRLSAISRKKVQLSKESIHNGHSGHHHDHH